MNKIIKMKNKIMYNKSIHIKIIHNKIQKVIIILIIHLLSKIIINNHNKIITNILNIKIKIKITVMMIIMLIFLDLII